MRIGNLLLDNPFFLAPMAGITDSPFRRVCKEQGAGLVYSANDSGIVDSDSYKGVTATFTLGGTDIAKVESIKVELFDAEDNLLATNALKSHKFPLGAGNLTAPIVAIEGTYAYGSWEKTVWTDGNPDPLTPPSYVVMTLTDKNGVTYSAEERNLHTVHSGGGDWASLWGVKVVGTEGELRDALVNTDVERIILGNDISLTDHLDIRRSVVLDGKGNTITAVFNKVDGALIHLRNADNVTIKNVTITTAEDKRMMGIDNTGSIDGLIIERVTFKDMELGFYSNGEINGKIEDCIFENLNKGIGYSHSPSFHLLFKDNIFRNIKSMYFEIFGEPSDEVVNAIIENNVFLYKDIEVAVIVDDEGNIVATEVYVTTEEELIAALANTDVKGIILGDNMNLTAQLRLSRPLVLDGNGKTITVEKAEENQAILLTSDDIEIRSFTVVGSTMNWGIVLVAGIEGVVIDDVTVTGMGGGIYANPDSQGEIKNCTFDTLGTGIGYDRSDFEITGNSFEDITSMYLEIFGNHTEEEIAEILLNNAFDYPVKVVIEENGLKRYTIIAQ
jgi:predicted regulator of Ras-like GTPase activity (Roadblock/LC7/MglB family)